jgi:hypothetical protein
MASLEPLYDFVTEHRDNRDALHLGTELGQEYSRRCAVIANEIEATQGLYVWGRYDCKRYWHTIYIGIAGCLENKKNLKKRIIEELKDERGFVWRYVFSKKELECRLTEMYQGKYTWKRAMLKAGATDIVWIATPGLAEGAVTRVEADLIEALDPDANLSRPTPTTGLQVEATEIFSELRRTIHAQRPKKPSTVHRLVDKRLSEERPISED